MREVQVFYELFANMHFDIENSAFTPIVIGKRKDTPGGPTTVRHPHSCCDRVSLIAFPCLRH